MNAQPLKAVRVLRPIPAGALKLEGFARQTWVVDLSDDITLEDLQSPDLWCACASLGMNDVVEIRQPSRWSQGVVGDVGAGFVRMDIVSCTQREPRAEGDEQQRVPRGHVIRRHRVDDPAEAPEYVAERLATEKAGAVILNLNFQHATYEEALRFLLDHATIRGEATVRYI